LRAQAIFGDLSGARFTRDHREPVVATAKNKSHVWGSRDYPAPDQRRSGPRPDSDGLTFLYQILIS
jgi:hypothetical protein